LGGWSEQWDTVRSGRSCPVCDEGRPEEADGRLRVFAGETVDAYLDRDDAVRGYTLAYFRGRHVVEPTELTEEEAGRFWRDLLTVARAIEDEYAPIKMNLLFLGNAMPHLHVHLVPRYLDDPDAGAPPRFMMATSDWRRLDEADYLRQVEALRVRLSVQITGS
jgi:diadenosine tetraphosphate (Ap4A) HIT family hydrolase